MNCIFSFRSLLLVLFSTFLVNSGIFANPTVIENQNIFYERDPEEGVFFDSELFSQSQKLPQGRYWIFMPSISETVGRGIGFSRDYTTLETLIVNSSVSGDSLTPFIDLQGHYFQDNHWAANAGIGGRYYLKSLNMTAGGNVYYDYRELGGTNFSQVGVGIELFSECWNFRCNGYFPVGQKTSHISRCLFDDYLGGYVMSLKRYYAVQKSCDVEFESLLVPFNECRIYGALGSYYLTRNSYNKNALGVLVSLRAYSNSYFSANVTYSYDHIYGSRTNAQFFLTFPFEVFNCCFQYTKPCWQPVQRRHIIPIKEHCCWKTNFN